MLISSTPGGPPLAEVPKHRISVCWRNGCRDVFQIQFAGPSIFVHFPYQPDSPGVVSRRELPPGVTHTFDVTEAALAMTRKIKYSHPSDGRAHFSQDGKIFTEIRNQAQSLDSSVGHFFSIDIAGIEHFRQCKGSLPKETVNAQFVFPGDQPVDPVHFAGFWYRTGSGLRPTGLTNPVLIDRGTGSPDPALAIAPAPDSPLSGGVLAIFARPNTSGMQLKSGDFYILFTGGFGANLADIQSPSSFLALQYPVQDISHLPSIDFDQLSG